MRNYSKIAMCVTAAVLGCLLMGLAYPAGANDGQLNALPAPAAYDFVASSETVPPPADQAVCRPPIVYKVHRSARRAYACSGERQMVMITENPADCCLYEIPLCIPACCEGAPSVDSHCGLLGRGVVEYCWPCGFSAKVIFRLRGDVKVSLRG